MRNKEPSVAFDFRTMDSLADRLLEKFSAQGLTREAAEAVAAWHLDKLTAAENEGRVRVLVRVIGGLLMARRLDISVRGLAYALGYDKTNGIGTQKAEAKRVGCSRAAIWKATEQWKNLLGIKK
jgi:hypothetical protein